MMSELSSGQGFGLGVEIWIRVFMCLATLSVTFVKSCELQKFLLCEMEMLSDVWRFLQLYNSTI